MAAGALAVGGCTGAKPTPRRRVSAAKIAAPSIDGTFAELALQALERPALRAELRAHPALAALVRHRQLSGGTDVDAERLLEAILDNVKDVAGAERVLAHWRGREALLAQQASAAKRYLPEGHGFSGTLFWVVGYDIGVAAPPDIAINVAHPHFVSDPREAGYYATHEAHHVGFFAVRGPPPLKGIEQANRLRSLVRYMTQLEGMAVHAVYLDRARDGALGRDDDYAVYSDGSEAERVVEAYAKYRRAIPSSGTVAPANIGEVLNAMSSGERLAYRFGALVARQIEQEQGRATLVRSMGQAEIFDSVARRLAGLP